MDFVIQEITAWLITQNVLSAEDRELYEYSIRSFGITFISVAVAILIGTLMDGLLHSIVFVVPFMLLRRYCGGYHAESFGRCMCYSCILLVFVFQIVGKVQNVLGIGALALISVASLYHFSPVVSAARVLSLEELKENKCIARKMLLVYALAVLTLLLVHAKEFAIRLAMGIVLTAVLQVPCLTKKGKYLSFGTK